MTRKSVNNNIKDYRVNAKITQEELAKELGVSRQSIISIERGHYIPSLPLALKFARFFHCSTDDLFQLKEEV